MAQNYNIECFDSTAGEGIIELQLMENNFECLRTVFSGTTEPSESGAGQLWFDNGTGKELLKIRDYNNDWIGIMTGDITHKIWVYSNSAGDGWIISTSVTDCVVSIKGGSYDYNKSGGQSGGVWTQPLHPLTQDEIPAHVHDSAGAHTHYLPTIQPPYSMYIWYVRAGSFGYTWPIGYAGAHAHPSAGGGLEHNHGSSTYRPLAAVGIMINLNI